MLRGPGGREIVVEVDEPDSVEVFGAIRKLRAGERRDNAMADFCAKQAKLSKHSLDPAARRDTSYWLDMSAYFRGTEEYRAPARRPIPTTRRLEFLERAARVIDRARQDEVGYLRSRGVAWRVIADAVGITRQAAQKRWAEWSEPYAESLRYEELVAQAQEDATRDLMQNEADALFGDAAPMLPE